MTKFKNYNNRPKNIPRSQWKGKGVYYKRPNGRWSKSLSLRRFKGGAILMVKTKKKSITSSWTTRTRKVGGKRVRIKVRKIRGKIQQKRIGGKSPRKRTKRR